MAKEQGRILLAVDGEPHTEAAVCWAIDLAIALGMKLNPVHVRDPYLKQFYNEIYAQGREEYLQHVEDCLVQKAEHTLAEFESAVQERVTQRGHPEDFEWTFDVLDGEPAEQLTQLIERGEFSMIVLGRRHRTRAKALRSRDLAERLSRVDCRVPLLVVPER